MVRGHFFHFFTFIILRIILCLEIRSILSYVACALEKNVFFSVIFCSIYKCSLIQLVDDPVYFISSILLLIFDLLILLITKAAVLKCPTIIAHFSYLFFRFSSFASFILKPVFNSKHL